ncbi:hypothetical protein [Streptomyces sp. NPDC002467]|uniref:hypothetical protein n=1 Tax=Streptomyces sp. NPDC002467 TaxID=3364647 RepID=UPI0036AD78EA
MTAFDPIRFAKLVADYQANVEPHYLAGRKAQGDAAAAALIKRWPHAEVAELVRAYKLALG